MEEDTLYGILRESSKFKNSLITSKGSIISGSIVIVARMIITILDRIDTSKNTQASLSLLCTHKAIFSNSDCANEN